jgi:Regulator of Chromosome Condensation (RCC1) repeat protein
MAMSPSGSCGVLTAGRAHCWGRWNGALIKLGQPADPLTDVAELRIGHDVLGEQHYVDHLCARDTHQRVQCRGNGHQGQLGPAGGDSVAAPLGIDGIPPVSQLALGAHHTCALTTAGEVLCWGSNEYGQLGIGKSAEVVRQPTPVTLARKVAQIVASHFDTCALTDDHEVYCWGENLRGETGAPNPAADRGIRTAWTPYHAALAERCPPARGGVLDAVRGEARRQDRLLGLPDRQARARVRHRDPGRDPRHRRRHGGRCCSICLRSSR